MQFHERSYGGKLFRPRPEIFLSDDQKILILATPWGPRPMAQAFIEKVQTEMQDSNLDPDRTMIGLPLDTLSEEENRLRLALFSIHEDLRDEYNADSLTAGLEIFCLIKGKKKLSWFQVGGSFLAVQRAQLLYPLRHSLDLSFDHSKTHILPPLPKELYGLSQQVSLNHGSLLYQKKDRLFFIERSYIPSQFFQTPPENLNIEAVTQLMASENPEHPFWIGQLTIAS